MPIGRLGAWEGCNQKWVHNNPWLGIAISSWGRREQGTRRGRGVPLPCTDCIRMQHFRMALDSPAAIQLPRVRLGARLPGSVTKPSQQQRVCNQLDLHHGNTSVPAPRQDHVRHVPKGHSNHEHRPQMCGQSMGFAMSSWGTREPGTRRGRGVPLPCTDCFRMQHSCMALDSFAALQTARG
jgi:hypothetical protein